MTTRQENLSEKIVLSENDKKFMQDWENTKSKGFWKYVIIEGLKWGFISGILSGLMLGDYNNIQGLLVRLIIFILCGIIGYAPSMWKINEKKYQKFQNKIQ